MRLHGAKQSCACRIGQRQSCAASINKRNRRINNHQNQTIVKRQSSIIISAARAPSCALAAIIAAATRLKSVAGASLTTLWALNHRTLCETHSVIIGRQPSRQSKSSASLNHAKMRGVAGQSAPSARLSDAQKPAAFMILARRSDSYKTCRLFNRA